MLRFALPIALLSTGLIWILWLDGPQQEAWPSVLATAGFWLLALLARWVQGRRR